MVRTVTRRGGRIPPRTAPRRVVDVARGFVGSSTLGTTPLVSDVFSAYDTDAGILNHPAGITIVGIRYTLAVGLAALNSRLQWGFIVVPAGIAASVIHPGTNQHADFMEWGSKAVTTTATAWENLVGNGDEGFRTVRSMRKLKEMQSNLAFVIVNDVAGPISYECDFSVHFKLP